MTQQARIYNGEKTVFSVSGDGKTEQLTCKRVKLEHSQIPGTKLKSKWMKRPKCRTGSYKTP